MCAPHFFFLWAAAHLFEVQAPFPESGGCSQERETCVLIVAGHSKAKQIPCRFSSFSPPFMREDLVATISLTSDITGCNASVKEGDVALMQRGSCSFAQKVVQAQNSGAKGVMIYDTENRTLLVDIRAEQMNLDPSKSAYIIEHDGTSHSINIPVLSIAKINGQQLAKAIKAGKNIFLAVDKSQRNCTNDEKETKKPALKRQVKKRQKQPQRQKPQKQQLQKQKRQPRNDEKDGETRQQTAAHKVEEVLIGARSAITRLFPGNFHDDQVGIQSAEIVVVLFLGLQRYLQHGYQQEDASMQLLLDFFAAAEVVATQFNPSRTKEVHFAVLCLGESLAQDQQFMQQLQLQHLVDDSGRSGNLPAVHTYHRGVAVSDMKVEELQACVEGEGEGEGGGGKGEVKEREKRILGHALRTWFEMAHTEDEKQALTLTGANLRLPPSYARV